MLEGEHHENLPYRKGGASVLPFPDSPICVTKFVWILPEIYGRIAISCMEAEYTSIRLAELVTKESVSRFDFAALCDMHYYIFQDIYEWAGR